MGTPSGVRNTILLVERILERLASLKGGQFRRGDVDLFAGLRIVAFASGANLRLKGAKANDGNLIASL